MIFPKSFQFTMELGNLLLNSLYKIILEKKLLNSSKSSKSIKFTIGFPIQKIKIFLIL